MKLRNKKTGEIIEVGDRSVGIHSHAYQGFYHTIAELNEEWEDYEPIEPLIKDEKIRKAVRAWAEATGVSKVMVAHPNSSTTTLADISDPYNQISFSNERAFLPMGKTYIIAELCGEEEE